MNPDHENHAPARDDKAVETARSDLDWPPFAGAVDEVLEGLKLRARRRRRIFSAAAGAAAILMAGLISRNHRPGALAGAPVGTLVVVQPRRQILPDGSIVEFKNGASVKIDFNDRIRLVELLRGTAYFEVMKDSHRPFIVRVAGLSVRAVGTVFSVDLAEGHLTVLVNEGRVAVNYATLDSSKRSNRQNHASDPSATLALVEAGHSVVMNISSMMDRDPIVRALPKAEINTALSWTIPLLKFSGTPLDEVAAIMNQHNRVKLVIADPSVATMKLSGILRANKLEALVAMVQSDYPVKVERPSDSEIVLRRLGP